MSIYDSILCDITCYGTMGSAERKALVEAIGDVEVELNTNDVPRYWACYCRRTEMASTFYVSCSALPFVLTASSLEGIINLIDGQKETLMRNQGRYSAKT